MTLRKHSHERALARSAALVLAAALVIGVCPELAAEQPPPAQPTTPAGPAVTPPPASPANAGDPFARLRVKIPKDQLPPLRSVRIRDTREKTSERIVVWVNSKPSGAFVFWGRKRLGVTPLKIVVEKGKKTTPMDIVLKHRGYMTLRTRIQRRAKYKYYFALHPAKFR